MGDDILRSMQRPADSVVAPSICLFDVNATLLDIELIAPWPAIANNVAGKLLCARSLSEIVAKTTEELLVAIGLCSSEV